MPETQYKQWPIKRKSFLFVLRVLANVVSKAGSFITKTLQKFLAQVSLQAKSRSRYYFSFY